jgi:hypothetical protein
LYITAISSILIAVMFSWHRSLARIRYRVLLLALIPLLSILSSFTPFFAKTALAVTPDEVLTAARAWSVLNAVIENASYLDSSISGSDADSCHIFGTDDNDGIFVGHHVTGNNDTSQVVSSDGASWDALEDRVDIAKSALAKVGIENGCTGLLQKIGYTFGDGDLNAPRDFSNGDNDVRNKLRDAVKSDAFFGARIGNDSPGDAISYAILYYNLVNVCGWQYRNPWNPDFVSSPVENARNQDAAANGWSGDTNGAHYRTWTYENGEARWNTYYKGGGTQDDVNVGPKNGFTDGGNGAQLDCADYNGDTFGAKLADNHRYADAYLALIKPGGGVTAGTCKDKYPFTGGPEQKWLTACDDGFKNKSDSSFCETKYPPSAGQQTYEACRYGQTTATGGADTTTPPPGTGEQPKTNENSCAITGVGWIICPVVVFLAEIVDGAYAFVSSMLEVQPILTTGGTQGVYDAWQVMRNFSNVAFVIAFLIIIFSQLTSIGIGNYGIKKMLPRLVIAAVLVNVSYWLCSIAVDLSNIGGNSFKAMFEGIKEGIQLPNFSSFGATEGGWTGIAGTILAGGIIGTVALYAQLSALLPMLVTVLFAIVTVFIVLTLRQALIILLIVVSPLAFVAFLLPNTESLFKQWRSLFQVLLLMYPLISLIFGASSLASTIVMGSASGDYKIIVQIMGAAIAIIPLFILPIVMKVAGGVLNRVGAFINNPNKGPFDKLRKGAERVANDEKARRQARAYNGTGRFPWQGASYRRQARRAAVTAQLGNNAQRAQQQYLAQQAQNNPAFLNTLAGGNRLNGATPNQQALARALASAIEVNVKADIEEVKASSALIENANLNRDDLRALAGGGSAGGLDASTNLALRRAAMQSVVASNDIHGMNNLVDDSRSWTGDSGDKMRKTLADSLASSSARPAYIGQGAIAAIKNNSNTSTAQELVEKAIADNAYSPEKIAKADKDELNFVANVVKNNTTITTTDRVRLSANATRALQDPKLSQTIGKNLENVQHIEDGTAPLPLT